jgi:peptidylprolyl isomerase
MAQVKEGDSVKVHYKGMFDDGQMFHSSAGKEPLEFTLGLGEVIPGFENAVLGMESGQSKTVTINSAEAYGPHYDEMVIVVEKDRMPDDVNPEIGHHLQMRRSDGRIINFIVIDVSEKDVTLDANHPLAGKDLIFDIELVEIK